MKGHIVQINLKKRPKWPQSWRKGQKLKKSPKGYKKEEKAERPKN
jgi:hypothetical protein